MGLGLSIDWSLLVVSRFREELATSREGAVARTIASAGRTVVFSSLTVAAAMASLLVFPQRFLLSMGVGGVLVSLVGGAVALIVLPAVLALLGPRVNALAPRRWQRAPTRARRWYSLARFVMRRAPVVAAASAIAPAPARRAVPARARSPPQTRACCRRARARAQVYEQLTATSRDRRVPFYAVLRGRRARRGAFAARVSALRGSPRALPPRELAPGVWKLDVNAGHDYLSGDSQRLVREIRALPTPLDVLVGGGSAGFADEKSSLARHLPPRSRS